MADSSKTEQPTQRRLLKAREEGQFPSAREFVSALQFMVFLGLLGAVALTRVIASLLFGVTTMDAVTFLAVPTVLAAVAFAATVIPALRASKVDPMVALREE